MKHNFGDELAQTEDGKLYVFRETLEENGQVAAVTAVARISAGEMSRLGMGLHYLAYRYRELLKPYSPTGLAGLWYYLRKIVEFSLLKRELDLICKRLLGGAEVSVKMERLNPALKVRALHGFILGVLADNPLYPDHEREEYRQS